MAPRRSPVRPKFVKTFAVTAIVAVGCIAVHAEKVKFINNCYHPINLVHALKAKSNEASVIQVIAPKDSFSGDYSGPAHMFRHGMDPQATLAELTLPPNEMNLVWYDISIIPTGPGNCGSYEKCKEETKRKGFNVPMSIKPQTPTQNDNCRELVCLDDDKVLCKDAYHFPSDTKTHACPQGTALDVTFCP